MKRILVLLFVTSAVSSFAQLNTASISLLEDFIRQVKPEGSIIYTDKINNADLLNVLMRIKEGTIRGNTPGTTANSINITKQERKELEKLMRMLAKPYWQQKVFLDSRMITEDNVFPYIKTVFQQYSETYADPRNSTLDKSNLLKNSPQPFVFEFTPPLFFRNDSYCFIYMKTVSGNYTSSEMTFLRKDNDRWLKYVVVTVN